MLKPNLQDQSCSSRHATSPPAAPWIQLCTHSESDGVKNHTATFTAHTISLLNSNDPEHDNVRGAVVFDCSKGLSRLHCQVTDPKPTSHHELSSSSQKSQVFSYRPHTLEGVRYVASKE